jgi:hypothetical protein
MINASYKVEGKPLVAVTSSVLPLKSLNRMPGLVETVALGLVDTSQQQLLIEFYLPVQKYVK